MGKTKFGKLTVSGMNVTHEIDIAKIKSPDPLAYAYGFVQGERGEKLPRQKGIASEYIRGWKEGHKNYLKLKRHFNKLKKVM